MFRLLKSRKQLGRPAIPDIRKAQPSQGYHGFPLLKAEVCAPTCEACERICPTEALRLNPLRLDLGKCVFCGQCEKACPSGVIRFSGGHLLASTRRAGLIVAAGQTSGEFARTAVEARTEIARLFGRSLKLRQVSAGGCNACEAELAACGNVNFDMGRFGIEFTASPRHADGVVLTGPITKTMAPALRDTFRGIGDPKILIAAGTCAIGGGVFADSGEIDRSFLKEVSVDLFVPGCPPHPLTFIRAVLDFLKR